MIFLIKCLKEKTNYTDPDLQIGGPGHPDPEIRMVVGGGRGGGTVSKKISFGPLFDLRIRGAAPPGPSPGFVNYIE